MNTYRKTTRRNRNGSVLLEFTCGACLLAIAALIGVNIGLVAFAASWNSTACRDAARAAAQQSTPDAARRAAQAAITRFSVNSPILTSPELNTTTGAFEYQQFLDPQGRPNRTQGPFVRITTAVSATMPAPIMWSGTGLSSRLRLQQSYVMPLMSINTPGT